MAHGRGMAKLPEKGLGVFSGAVCIGGFRLLPRVTVTTGTRDTQPVVLQFCGLSRPTRISLG